MDTRLVISTGLDANDLTVVNVATPVNPHDAANKQYIDGLVTGNGVKVGVLQARRSTTYVTTTTATDITFDVTDVITNTNICYLDGTNTARLTAAQTGTYKIVAELEIIAINTSSVLSLRFFKNGTTALPNTLSQRSASTTARVPVTYTAVVELVAGDYVTLQASHTSNSVTIQANAVVVFEKLEGVQGVPGVMGGDSSFYYAAGALDSPNSSDWAINALAPLIASSNAAINVRAFDDTAEEGTGFTAYIPPSATNLTLTFVGKAATSPATAKAVVLRLYRRTISIGSAITAWSSALQLDTLNIPTNSFFQSYAQTFSVTSLGLTAGTIVQFELTRQGSSVSDTLSGDWHLFNVTVSFS